MTQAKFVCVKAHLKLQQGQKIYTNVNNIQIIWIMTLQCYDTKLNKTNKADCVSVCFSKQRSKNEMMECMLP